MSNGVFGSVRAANINVSTDVEILYYYRPSRGEVDATFNSVGFQSLSPSECLIPSTTTNAFGVSEDITGLFNLKLPLNDFNKKGIYTIYIRPKEIKTTIKDVSVLAAYPEIKGVVLQLGSEFNGITDLTGYRIEFDNGNSRLIKSCYGCEPVIINTGDGYPKSTRYNLTDAIDLVFCTVSPSTAPSFKTNAAPYIGEPGLDVKVINTKFTPKVMEIEMVENDIETISYMLEGDQVTDRDNGIITTFNKDNEIYHQADYYILKDKLGNPLYNIKKKRENIDHTQDYDNTINNG